MAEVNWGLSVPYQDPTTTQARAFSYADAVMQNAAKFKAGGQFAQGDYSGAANTQAQAGDIQGAESTKNYGAAQFQQRQAYIARAVPIFQQIYQKVTASGGPEAAAQAVGNAFETLTPDLKSLGVSDDLIASYRQALAKDPGSTLQALSAVAARKFSYQKVGDNGVGVFDDNTGQMIGHYEGSKFITAPATDNIYKVGGDQPTGDPQAPPAPPPQQTASVAPPPAPSGDALFGNQQVQRGAVETVESGGNPNAVSPKGAIGSMQTMPSTLTNPGFGVAPAKDNSPQEQARVGQDYLAALTQHYGNPTLGLVAYNMGPGATDAWLKAGGSFKTLPQETQSYLGHVAVAQATGQGAAALGAPNTQASVDGAPAAAPAAAPALPPGVQVIQQAKPAWRAPTAAELKQYPGASQINEATGQVRYPPAAVSGQQAGDTAALGLQDPTSKSILGQTGLSQNAFMVLTGRASQLPRDAASRTKAQKEAEMFSKERGVDTSTLQSQFQAYNNVLQSNLQKSNALEILNKEVQGTVNNLGPVADKLGNGNLRWTQAGAAFVGGLQNDPNAQQYAFYLNQLRADLAGFNAISGGKVDQHGNAHADDSDFRAAESVIKNGLNSGGARGLAAAVEATGQKNIGIVESATSDAQRNIWKLFGVGENYDKVTSGAKPAAQRVIKIDIDGKPIH